MTSQRGAGRFEQGTVARRNIDTASAGRYGEDSESPDDLAMVERGGRARAIVVPDRSRETLHAAIRANVSPDATIYTDEFTLYAGLGAEFARHYTIKHTESIYAQGDVHTQTIEGFFGNVKRGLSGVQHNVSP